MRLRTLLEYDDLAKEKEIIVSRIAGMQADNDDDAKLLDRIYKILNSETIGNNISNAFAIPLQAEPLSDKEKDIIIKDMTKIIAGVDSDYKSMHEMVTQMEKKGGVVNIDQLKKPLVSFSSVFTHPAAMIAFEELKNYGTGKKQKGPGEYALASLSDKIRLASGEGDLEVDGIGKVELKSAVSSSGGRIGYGGGSQKAKRAVLDKYAEQIPTVIANIGEKGGSMGLGKFIETLNQDLPITDQAAKQTRYNIAKELFSMDMEEFAEPVAVAVRDTNNANTIEDEYLKANFAWYKDRDDFDALLLCSFPNKKFAMIRNDQDLLAFKQSGHANARSISVIPTQAGAGREQWAQLTLNKANV